MSIERKAATLVAAQLTDRFDPLRAVTLIGRLMMKALFRGDADDVLFWALVHVHFRRVELSTDIEEQLGELDRSRPARKVAR